MTIFLKLAMSVSVPSETNRNASRLLRTATAVLTSALLCNSAIYALQSTKILTCLSFSSISARKPSSATRSILILLVIIFSGCRLPSSRALMTPAKSCLR